VKEGKIYNACEVEFIISISTLSLQIRNEYVILSVLDISI